MSDDNLNGILIDRLKSFAAKPNANVEGFRSVAAKLHSRAASQGMFVSLAYFPSCVRALQ
jgi:hypothetical protein